MLFCFKAKKNEKVDKESLNKLEKARKNLIDELSDYKYRLKQEDKAYNTANDERKDILMKLDYARGALQVVNMKVPQKGSQLPYLVPKNKSSFIRAPINRSESSLSKSNPFRSGSLRGANSDTNSK